MNGGAVLETGQSLLRAPPSKMPKPEECGPGICCPRMSGAVLVRSHWDTQKHSAAKRAYIGLAALRAFCDLKLLRSEITVSEIPQR